MSQCFLFVNNAVCTGETSGSPQTPRRSVRLLAKQLYHVEVLEALSPVKESKKHLPKSPQHSQLDAEPTDTTSASSTRKLRSGADELMTSDSETESHNKPVVLITPPHISMHQHFVDSRQLDRRDSAAPLKKTPMKSPSRHETTSVRRSPRLSAKQDTSNLMETTTSAAKTNVGPNILCICQ